MTDFIGAAATRLFERAKEPKAQLLGLSKDLDAIAVALESVRNRLEWLAAAELHRHFNPGEPLPPRVFDELYRFGESAYRFAANSPLHNLVKR